MESNAEMDELRKSIRSLELRIGQLEATLISLPAAKPLQTAPVFHEPPPVHHATPPPLPVQTHLEIPQPLPTIASDESIIPNYSRKSLEATIGEHWAGWIGAIVFVLGMLFFLKYAWDQGWINPTPTMRILASITVGIALSVAGEWMHRRKVQTLAATLHGAGLAIVMASFFASYALFQPANRVLGVSGAFTGVVITAAIGVAIALHVDSIVLASIALIGAYLAPFVLNTGEDRSTQLLAYLGVLSAVGLFLSYAKPRWFLIRTLVWIGTFLSFALWWDQLGSRADHQQLAVAALGVYYLAFLLEMIFTLRKSDASTPALQTNAAIMSLINTAATCAMMRAIYPQMSSDVFLGVIAIGLAITQTIAAFTTKSRGFSISSLLQASALVTLAVPLILNHFVITLAWLALAVALAALAWELNLPSARAWAVVLLMLSIARLFIFDESHLRGIIFSLGTFHVSQWTLLAWGTAVLAQMIAWLKPGSPGRFPSLERRFGEIIPTTFGNFQSKTFAVLDYAMPIANIDLQIVDPLGIFISIIGTLLFLGASAMRFDGSTLTLLALIWALPLIALARYGTKLNYLEHALVILALVSVKWFVSDNMAPLLSDWNHPNISGILPPLMNFSVFNGLFLCGLLVGAIVHTKHGTSQMYAIAVWLAFIVLSFLNFETCRTVDWIALHNNSVTDPAIIKQVAMSVLWALIGFVTIAEGFRRGIAPLRYAALTLLGATLLKILLIDMAEVQAIWRILSFVAVGAFLLAVSFLYHKRMESRQAIS
jgi:uncharacterized membrane protein